MKLTGSEDLRVQKTILAIREAFQDLICKKDYPKITVKELCERARINKKTFYRYYPTLDDLLREVQEEVSGEYMERTRGLRMPDDVEKITREFCEFSAAQDTYYERITCSQTYDDVRGPMMERVMGQREGTGEEDAERAMMMAFITEGTLAIYRTWVEQGKPVSPERLADMSVELICGGVRRYLRERG